MSKSTMNKLTTNKLSKRFASTCGYLGALLRLNVRAVAARPMLTVTSAGMMIGNNLILFLIWIIYFGKFSNIRGWVLTDMSLLLGIIAWAVGLTFLLIGGVRDLAQTIVDGRLDVYLGRPRHPLPALLISRSIPAGIGDMTSAFLFWFWLGERSLADLPMLLLVSTSAAVVFSATLVIVQCLVFWFPRAQSLCEDLFNVILMVTFYPQHAYGFFIRVILFTVFPTAFMSMMPAQAIRDHDWLEALMVLAAAGVYSTVAVAIFNRGVRLYSSGNRVLEIR